MRASTLTYLSVALVLAAAGAVPSLARAATVLRLNAEHDKVLLLLTPTEMAALEPDSDVLLEVDKPRFVRPGRVDRMNPVKKTAVIVFDRPDDRFAPKQKVRFLPALWNAESSPLITSYAQYYQYARSGVEAAAGAFFEGTSEKVGSTRGFTQGYGSRLVAQGYALINPTWFGIGLGVEHRDIKYDDRATLDEAATLTYNAIRPGFWAELQPHLRLALKYNDTLIDEQLKDAAGENFAFTFGQPEATLTYYDDSGEIGVDYLAKAASSATFAEFSSAGTSTQLNSYMKMPAELYLYLRGVESPAFIWGAAVGYIFWERNLDPSLPLRPKAYPEQMLRLRFSLETRLDDGDKVDYVFSYDGAKALGYSTYEQRANMGGLAITYQTMAGDGLLLGGTFQASVGAAKQSDTQTDATTGQTDAVERSIVGYRASLLAFARYEFDLLRRGRGRARNL